MRKVNPRCVIFVLTAYPDLESAVEGINLRIDDYFTKPARADTLVASLAENLFAKQIQRIDYSAHADLRAKAAPEPSGTSETSDPTKRPN